MKGRLFAAVLLAASPHFAADVPRPASPAGGTSPDLPFDREIINRYSLDRLPRSLSIRQGKDVWIGYDLEHAKPCKVWQAPAGKPGLTTIGFVARSAGTTWFEDTSTETWQWERGGEVVTLAIRYLGCSQRETGFELSWELKHDTGVLKLLERIPRSSAPAAERVVRELRVESLAAGDALLLPGPARKAWRSSDDDRGTATRITGSGWHRLTLP